MVKWLFDITVIHCLSQDSNWHLLIKICSFSQPSLPAKWKVRALLPCWNFCSFGLIQGANLILTSKWVTVCWAKIVVFWVKIGRWAAPWTNVLFCGKHTSFRERLPTFSPLTASTFSMPGSWATAPFTPLTSGEQNLPLSPVSSKKEQNWHQEAVSGSLLG